MIKMTAKRIINFIQLASFQEKNVENIVLSTISGFQYIRSVPLIGLPR